MPKKDLTKPKEKVLIEENEIRVIREEIRHGGKSKAVLRWVSWVIDGKVTASSLEKRDYLLIKDKWIMRKRLGLSQADLDFIFANRENVMAALAFG